MNIDEKSVTDPTDAEWTDIVDAYALWERVAAALGRYGQRVAEEAYALGRQRGENTRPVPDVEAAIDRMMRVVPNATHPDLFAELELLIDGGWVRFTTGDRDDIEEMHADLAQTIEEGLTADAQTPQETPQELRFCSGCSQRSWNGDSLPAAELCHECWKKVRTVVHAPVQRYRWTQSGMVEHHAGQYMKPVEVDVARALPLRDGVTTGWQPIERYSDDGEVVVWNGHQAYRAYYQDPDGWFADVDGELLRIVPAPTLFIPVPAQRKEPQSC